MVLGAENRAIQHRLFFGYDNERLIRATRVPVVVVVPHLAEPGPMSGRSFDISFRRKARVIPPMAAPIVHLEFRSFDFARTSAFYAKVFDWRTEQNASSTYMKLDADEGPSAGWVRAELSQAPGPLAYVVVDDLATTLAEVEAAGGRVLVPKLAFAGGGEVALFADPDGNVVGLWMRKDRPAAGGPQGGSQAGGGSGRGGPPKSGGGKANDKAEKAADKGAEPKAKPAAKKR